MSTTFSLTGQVRVTPSWVDDLSTTDLVDSVTFLQSLSLASGTGAGQATAYWRDVLSVGAAATVTIDLEQLTVNVFGGAGGLNLETQKLILVRNRSTTIGVAVALGTAVTADLDPGGIVLATSTATGWSEDELTLTNAGGSAVSVEVYLVGLAGIYVAPVGPSVPGQPNIDGATANNGTTAVVLIAGTDDGGSPITSYEFTFDDVPVAPATSDLNTLTFIFAANYQGQDVRARAVNAVGAGPYSDPALVG